MKEGNYSIVFIFSDCFLGKEGADSNIEWGERFQWIEANLAITRVAGVGGRFVLAHSAAGQGVHVIRGGVAQS